MMGEGENTSPQLWHSWSDGGVVRLPRGTAAGRSSRKGLTEISWYFCVLTADSALLRTGGRFIQNDSKIPPVTAPKMESKIKITLGGVAPAMSRRPPKEIPKIVPPNKKPNIGRAGCGEMSRLSLEASSVEAVETGCFILPARPRLLCCPRLPSMAKRRWLKRENRRPCQIRRV